MSLYLEINKIYKKAVQMSQIYYKVDYLFTGFIYFFLDVKEYFCLFTRNVACEGFFDELPVFAAIRLNIKFPFSKRNWTKHENRQKKQPFYSSAETL